MNALRRKWQNLRATLQLMRDALAVQQHNNEAVRSKYENAGLRDRKRTLRVIKRMEKRSKTSIQNTYVKVQIGTALVIAVIAVLITMIHQLKHVVMWMMTTAIIMEVASIGVLLLTTIPSFRTTWLETVEEPGLMALNRTEAQQAEFESRVAFNERVMLLGKRRLAWLATCTLTVPGLALAMMSWEPWPTLIVLVALGVLAWCYRRFIRTLPKQVKS